MKTVLAVAIGAVTALSGGCASLGSPFSDPRTAVRTAAETGGLEQAMVRAGQFELVAYHRGLGAGGRLHVYVEGDGRAWSTRHRLSPDPTPRDPVALRLALRDTAPAVLYVARPCQFLDPEALRACPSRYWSSHRYAEEVVEALDRAIDWALAFWPRAGRVPPRLGLIGYSGGGTVAALLADRRADAAWLVTVAANLDHAAWTAHHGVTPLHGSLNPARLGSSRLDRLPQLHLTGGRDRVVPGRVLDSYLRARHLVSEETRRVYPDYSHRCCWPEPWPGPLEAVEGE